MELSLHNLREIFSKSCQIKPKSDCIYHAPIELEQQTDSVRLLFQINRNPKDWVNISSSARIILVQTNKVFVQSLGTVCFLTNWQKCISSTQS